MQILVDADACPVVVKDMLFRAAQRVQVSVTLVANHFMRTPPSRFIKLLQVPAGFDVADQRIVELANAGDLVITADIPLAAPRSTRARRCWTRAASGSTARTSRNA
jgi:uncharacterized protein YaiI (UPF0178 family)